MDNNDKIKLLELINKPLCKESIMMLYDSHNIKYEKCELFGDFVQSLYGLVFNTYLADEKNTTINLDKDILKIWSDIFDYEKDKTKYEMDMLIEVYSLLEKSLK